MKKSELKSYIKEEVKKVLTTEASKDEITNQKELNRELEKTTDLVSKMSQIKNVKEQGEKLAKKGLNTNIGESSYTKITSPLVKFLDLQQFTQSELKDLEYISDKIFDYAENTDIEFSEDEALNLAKQYTAIKNKQLKEQEEDEEDDWYKSKDEDGDKDKEPSKADLKKQAAKTKGVAKAKDELAILTREMKSLAKKYKEAKGAEKDKIVADLKSKTKLKKELEAILDK
jgi:hypothetical protein